MLAPDAAPPAASAERDVALVAERRLVSVLFADLVGFTAASERRDAEETRELLSRLFRALPSADRAVRRLGREVHRRRGDGGVGRAGRDRRTTLSGRCARRSSWWRRCRRSGEEVGDPESAGAGRRADAARRR